MIRRNLKIAFRLLLKHKSTTFINIIGLSISLACALFILLWVQHELSYDRFHPDYKRICRVEENQFYSNNPEAYHVNVTPVPSGPVWKEEIPEIEEQCRLGFAGGLFSYEDKKFFEGAVVAVDSSFFKMFGVPLLKGDPDHILNEPNTMVISEEIAEKYFGDEEAMGKSIKVDNEEFYTVTGIMKKMRSNSNIQADILLPWSYRKAQIYYNDSWGNNSIGTMVKLTEGAIDSIVNRKITEVTNIHKEGNTILFEVKPMHRIRLHSYFGYKQGPTAIIYVYIFSIIAIFVVIIACINFMNMSTAKSSLRAKEIGLRKVSGASKKQLVSQYLSESFLQTFISVILSLVLVVLFLNKFNDISGKKLEIADLFNINYILGIIGVLIFTALVAGSYPALYLSSLQPVRAIKDQGESKRGSSLLRKILVVFQFSLSVLLISGAFVINRQLNFMKNADLGFNKYELVNVPLRGGLNTHYKTIKDELLKNPAVEYVSASMQEGYRIGSNSSNITWPGKDPDEDFLTSFTAVDYDFIHSMGIKLADGRPYSEEYPADVYHDTLANFIINSTLAELIDKEEIIDMSMSFMGISGRVVGIMEDFHFSSLRNNIEPLAIIPIGPEYLTNMIIRLKPGNTVNTMEQMEEKWNEIVPDFPFEYTFVENEIKDMYRTEERMSTLIAIFTIVAVIIACMGLFALTSFTAERRTREIGVRKTFGAAEGQISWMMIRDFTVLIIIALVIALPAVWFLALKWLKDFSFRIDLEADIFIFAALVSIIVSVVTTLYHAIRSSRINPVLALRDE
jgi:putative ABC transport system permease protein